MKFKVGDKVRCVDASDAEYDLTQGQIYEVVGIGMASVHVIGAQGHKVSYYSNRFEPVESDLDTLIDTANKGIEALNAIKKSYRDQVEFSNGYVINDEYQNSTTVWGALRKKQTKRTFKVADWDASIQGDKVTIGCKEFDKHQITNALICLVREDREWTERPKIATCRTGLIHAGNKITWEQAEALLKELEGVK